MKICILLVISFWGYVCRLTGEEDSLVIFFWNVENLFYPGDDSLRMDDEFTPEGERFWSWYRYYSKNARIWKTIIAAGDSRPPPVICLAEIENRQVLNDLFIFSPPGQFEYEIIHEESNDQRGIDVAILYDPERIMFRDYRIIRVDLKNLGGRETRDILLASFRYKTDSFRIFLNHWPSKYGGAGITEKFRMRAAHRLVKELNVLYEEEPWLKAICLGDFNDTESSNSIRFLIEKGDLNLITPLNDYPKGSLKFQGKWQLIDHVLVSRGLITPGKGLKAGNVNIYCPGFLLENDSKYGGKKPFRTWYGFSYREGFSDHLPIIVTLSF